jgi:ATP-dependent Lon protease
MQRVLTGRQVQSTRNGATEHGKPQTSGDPLGHRFRQGCNLGREDDVGRTMGMSKTAGGGKSLSITSVSVACTGTGLPLYAP